MSVHWCSGHAGIHSKVADRIRIIKKLALRSFQCIARWCQGKEYVLWLKAWRVPGDIIMTASMCSHTCTVIANHMPIMIWSVMLRLRLGIGVLDH